LGCLGVAVTLIVIFVLVWIPAKVYYADGMLPAVVAAGSVPTEPWIAQAGRPHARRAAIGFLALADTLVVAPLALPLLPIASLHTAGGATVNIADGIGWPQLTADVAAQDAALTRAGQPPTSHFYRVPMRRPAHPMCTGAVPPAAGDLGSQHVLAVGSGDASDTTVLYLDAAGRLWRYFASCRSSPSTTLLTR
jgi:hypothetical protein